MIASTEATSSDESGRSREGPRALAFETTMEELAAYMRGWCGYFGFSETPEVLVALTRWVRWRPRAALGASGKQLSLLLGFQMHTSNRSACCPCSNGVSATSRAAVYGPARTVVWEGRNREAPPYPDRSAFVHWPIASILAGRAQVSFRRQSRRDLLATSITARDLTRSAPGSWQRIGGESPPRGRSSQPPRPRVMRGVLRGPT